MNIIKLIGVERFSRRKYFWYPKNSNKFLVYFLKVPTKYEIVMMITNCSFFFSQYFDSNIKLFSFAPFIIFKVITGNHFVIASKIEKEQQLEEGLL